MLLISLLGISELCCGGMTWTKDFSSLFPYLYKWVLFHCGLSQFTWLKSCIQPTPVLVWPSLESPKSWCLWIHKTSKFAYFLCLICWERLLWSRTLMMSLNGWPGDFCLNFRHSQFLARFLATPVSELMTFICLSIYLFVCLSVNQQHLILAVSSVSYRLNTNQWETIPTEIDLLTFTTSTTYSSHNFLLCHFMRKHQHLH